jgi:hypothetical protein
MGRAVETAEEALTLLAALPALVSAVEPGGR